MLFLLKRQCCLASFLLLVSAAQNTVFSRTSLTPTLQVEETFITNKTASIDESGQITTISPGIRYEALGAKSNLSLTYALNVIESQGLSQSDEVDHTLSLQSGLTHIPGRWNSYLVGGIKKTNVSSDGVQIVNPRLQSENSRELRTIGIGTSLIGKVSNNLNYQSGVDADFADIEDGDDSDSLSLNFGLNGSVGRSISWSTSLNSRRSRTLNSESQIDTVRGVLNYRINHQYSTFLTVDKSNTDTDTETDSDLLDRSNTSVGINWTPSRNSSLRLGVGKRGDDTTYSLDSFVKNNRFTYTLNYSENVTTSRALLIEDASNQSTFNPTSQSSSITPVLVKNGRIGVIVNGKRSTLSLNYFKQTTSGVDSTSQVTNGANISAQRTLSKSSSIRMALSRRKSETDQKNVVDDNSLSYNRQWSKKTSASAELRRTEQKSNLLANESKTNQLTFRINVVF